MLIFAYDATQSRANPNGTLVRFEATSDQPVTDLTLDLEGDGEPAVAVTFPVNRGSDGRFVRALAVKFTVNGTWPLIVTAKDSKNRSGSTRCTPGVTVTF